MDRAHDIDWVKSRHEIEGIAELVVLKIYIWSFVRILVDSEESKINKLSGSEAIVCLHCGVMML